MVKGRHSGKSYPSKNHKTTEKNLDILIDISAGEKEILSEGFADVLAIFC